jgi:NRPS condensation-like uncharacterized protein
MWWKKNGIANEFQVDLKHIDPKENQSLCNFSFLKIVKIEPSNKVQSFFSERNAFNVHKISLSISFTSQSFPCRYGPI